ncbi:MAG: hypothetical protein JWM98_484 [Thermoleophilia bacterium]|nr:hypothetical protein [Thermoleophilia bacterium]
MKDYVVLLRGINVGGKNRVPMAELRACLEGIGCTDVRTLIASGNVVLRSELGAGALGERIEAALPKSFALHADLVRVLVLTHAKLRAVVAERPEGFGEDPDTYHSDAIFLMGITAAKAMEVFSPREGVDRVWPGRGVIYSQRLSAERTKSRLGKIAGTDAYQSMTIRSWKTVLRLLAMIDG